LISNLLNTQSPMFELVPKVGHVDVHSDVVEQLSQESREVMDVPKVLDATTTPSYPVANDDVQEISNELVCSACGREESPVQNVVAHANVQYRSPFIQIPLRSFREDMEGIA
jgi:hypothetical protein